MSDNGLWDEHAQWWIDGFTNGADPEYVEQIMPLAVEELAGRLKVLDLGCGDGQILIAAARRGASGLGVDIDPYPLQLGRYYARRAGVAERVRFVRQDLFQTDLRQHNVVMLYLSVALNRRLLPKLRAELPRGARIVSHKFDMGGDWLPARTLQVDGVPIYLWIAPGPGA
jgi:SAM-dependent methyltransferase